MLIARLRGEIADVGLDGLLIDVAGVGYPVLVSVPTRAALPIGGTATLLIETQLREESVLYFGFLERDERDWFRVLTTVQGVGGKVALNILSALEPAALVRAIQREDRAALSRAEGVGPKLAARLATELKDRAAAWGLSADALRAPPAGRSAPTAAANRPADPRNDAVEALLGLQFRPGEAQTAVATAQRRLGEAASTQDLVRVALKEFGR